MFNLGLFTKTFSVTAQSLNLSRGQMVYQLEDSFADTPTLEQVMADMEASEAMCQADGVPSTEAAEAAAMVADVADEVVRCVSYDGSPEGYGWGV